MHTTLAQTLICRGGKVLLGTWKTGPFAGRVSGLLGEARAPSAAAAAGTGTGTGTTGATGVEGANTAAAATVARPPPPPELAAVEICAALAGVRVDARFLQRRALFTFVEEESCGAADLLGDVYVEHQLVYDCDAKGVPAIGEAVETDTFKPSWFSLAQIPYARMPEDDPVWYPRVLNLNGTRDGVLNGERLMGTFTFAGQTLTGHELDVVDDAVLAAVAPTFDSERSPSVHRR